MDETRGTLIENWMKQVDLAYDPIGLVRNEVNSFCTALRNTLEFGAELSPELLQTLIDTYLPYSSKMTNLSEIASEIKNQGYLEVSNDILLVRQLLLGSEAGVLEKVITEINQQLRVCQMLEDLSAKIDWSRYDLHFFYRLLCYKGPKDRGVYIQNVIAVLLPWSSLLSWTRRRGADSFGMNEFVSLMTWSWDRKNKDQELTDEEKAALFDPTQSVQTKLYFMKSRLEAVTNPSKEVLEYLEGINMMLELTIVKSAD